MGAAVHDVHSYVCSIHHERNVTYAYETIGDEKLQYCVIYLIGFS